MYLQYIDTLKKTYVQYFSKIEDKRNRLERILQRLDNISGQVEELQQELSDLQPRFEQISSEINKKKDTVSQLMAQRSAGLSALKQLEGKNSGSKASLSKLQTEYDEQMASDNEKVEAAINVLMGLKPADITLAKTIKTPPTCVKLVVAGMSLILAIQPEKMVDPQAKKTVTRIAYF
jgi:dynein heavy chain